MLAANDPLRTGDILSLQSGGGPADKCQSFRPQDCIEQAEGRPSRIKVVQWTPELKQSSLWRMRSFWRVLYRILCRRSLCTTRRRGFTPNSFCPIAIFPCFGNVLSGPGVRILIRCSQALTVEVDSLADCSSDLAEVRSLKRLTYLGRRSVCLYDFVFPEFRNWPSPQTVEDCRGMQVQCAWPRF